MERSALVLMTFFLISCQTKKSDISNMCKSLNKGTIVAEVTKDTVDDYRASFILENFIVRCKPDENEITVINEDCGVFMIPDSIQISKMKGKTKEEVEGFYIAADDNIFYQYEASRFLDSLRIKTIYPKSKYLKFINKKGSILFDTKSKYSDGWMVILFVNDRMPKIVDFVSFEESYNEYTKD